MSRGISPEHDSIRRAVISLNGGSYAPPRQRRLLGRPPRLRYRRSMGGGVIERMRQRPVVSSMGAAVVLGIAALKFGGDGVSCRVADGLAERPCPFTTEAAFRPAIQPEIGRKVTGLFEYVFTEEFAVVKVPDEQQNPEKNLFAVRGVDIRLKSTQKYENLHRPASNGAEIKTAAQLIPGDFIAMMVADGQSDPCVEEHGKIVTEALRKLETGTSKSGIDPTILKEAENQYLVAPYAEGVPDKPEAPTVIVQFPGADGNYVEYDCKAQQS